MPFIPLELTAREVGLLRKLAKRRRRSLHAQGAHLIALALATGLDEPTPEEASTGGVGTAAGAAAGALCGALVGGPDDR
jgi:hypothetical protein